MMCLWQRLWTALFPYIPQCVGCGAEKDVCAYLCPACAAELDALASGLTDAAGYSAYSAYRYEAIAARIVKRFKYDGSRWLCAFMTEAMVRTLAQSGVAFDAVCPVPLHPRKKRRRGFDQAALLAQGVAELTDKPYLAAITRIRNTPSQTKLNADQRRDNMRGAFEASEAVSGRVLLVDDVLTTGATSAECAAVLESAGAKSVTVLTFARAG